MRWLSFKNSTSEIFVREKRGTIILRGGKADGHAYARALWDQTEKEKEKEKKKKKEKW